MSALRLVFFVVQRARVGVAYYFFFLMIRRPPRSTLDRSSAASDVYKRQALRDEFPFIIENQDFAVKNPAKQR